MIAALFRSRLQRILAVLLFCFVGCGLVPKHVSLSDTEIKPMVDAMNKVDRSALGFTPVSTNAKIRLDLRSGGPYDAMLHVDGETSRTIAFRKTQQGYRWISEQEIHKGPKWRRSVDGNFREEIVVEYQTERVNGIPENEIYIIYDGEDPEIKRTDKLSLLEAQAIIQRWKSAPVEPEPPLLPGAGFDPAPVMFVLAMLLMFLIGCCIALFLAVVSACIATALLAFGIVSASILTAVLGKSVSSRFRTLFLQVGAVSGLLLGILLSLLAGSLLHLSWQDPTRTLISAMIGLSAGLVLAWVFNIVWMRIAGSLSLKLKRRIALQSPTQ
jgi:hypothetical protein